MIYLSLIKHYAKKTRGEWTTAPPFLTSAIDEGEWSASRPGSFIPDMKMGGPQTRFAQYGGDKTILHLPEIELRSSSHRCTAQCRHNHISNYKFHHWYAPDTSQMSDEVFCASGGCLSSLFAWSRIPSHCRCH
jgi:hypothetical protein